MLWVFLLLQNILADDLLEPKEIIELAIREESNLEYLSLSHHMHPEILKAFRVVFNEVLQELVKGHGEAIVKKAIQLPVGLPGLAEYSDNEFFAHITLCSVQFSPAPKYTKFDIVGSTLKGEKLYIIYQVKSEIDWIKEVVKMVSPRTRVFKKYQGSWKLCTLPIVGTAEKLREVCNHIQVSSESGALSLEKAVY